MASALGGAQRVGSSTYKSGQAVTHLTPAVPGSSPAGSGATVLSTQKPAGLLYQSPLAQLDHVLHPNIHDMVCSALLQMLQGVVDALASFGDDDQLPMVVLQRDGRLFRLAPAAPGIHAPGDSHCRRWSDDHRAPHNHHCCDEGRRRHVRRARHDCCHVRHLVMIIAFAITVALAMTAAIAMIVAMCVAFTMCVTLVMSVVLSTNKRTTALGQDLRRHVHQLQRMNVRGSSKSVIPLDVLGRTLVRLAGPKSSS